MSSMSPKKYTVSNMHGPTVYSDNDLSKAISNAKRLGSTNAGPYYVYESSTKKFLYVMGAIAGSPELINSPIIDWIISRRLVENA